MPAKFHKPAVSLVLEAIPYGFSVWCPQFRLLRWNTKFRMIFGISEAHLQANPTLEEFCKLSAKAGNLDGIDPLDHYERLSEQLLENRSSNRLKLREPSRGGRTVETTYSYSAGLGWVMAHEDITGEIARMEVENNRDFILHRQNIRLEAAVNNISHGLCMMDAKGRLVICNEPYARIYDLPQRLIRRGTHLEDILGYLFEKGMQAGETREKYAVWRQDVITKGKFGKNFHEVNGRTILMQQHPMSDGGWVTTHEDVTEQRKSEERIRHLARHDPLTSLANRSAFVEQMAAAERDLIDGQMVAVLYIDLDHFKAVNDTFGHAVGDEVLKLTSARLWGATRETDLLARLGGDEFALLMRPISGSADPAGLADRLIKLVAAPMAIGAQLIEIGASIGISVAPADGVNTETLVRNADLALYKAKGDGRSTYHFFELGMDSTLQLRRSIGTGLRSAIARNELRLVFQPLLSLEKNHFTSAEALLRWDSGGRTIPCSEFLPVAEEMGVIADIGEWMLREACRICARWPVQVRVAVKLFPAQFRNSNLPGIVVSALVDADMPAERLELGISESLLLSQNVSTIEVLHDLKAIGVRIAMNDFGTGYSSLAYLRSFPFDKIKIDGSFVRDIASNSDSHAIVRGVIGLMRSLGMSTAAEGVENVEQLTCLRSTGVSEVQGAHVSGPLSATDIDQKIFSTVAGPSTRSES